MLTNYKFAYILRKDNVHIDECGVRFYEGEVTTEDEVVSLDGIIEPVTRYRIVKKLTDNELGHLDGERKTEKVINDLVVYTTKDFGEILSDDELRVFLNGQLRLDTKRSPQTEQVTLDITKVK